jgi:hypothetical protein
MRATLLTALCLSVSPFSGAYAEKLGDHPAVIVQRLHAKEGYDYASKFYPHPAWLYLYAEAPRPMVDHPAVIVAKREKETKAQTAPAGCPVSAHDSVAPIALQR